jgi:hypothetical protein
MSSFYAQTLTELNMPRDARILVICGGALDREELLNSGYSSVTISNLDERMRGDEFSPYCWSSQDAEGLSYSNESFDYCIVHAGLHHCGSPHRGLLEMYRVAAKGVLVFEARDSLLMRLGIALKRVPEYELHSVRDNEFKWGGVRNSPIPNYIYRWTEREVRKTIASFAPHTQHTIRFFYGLNLPDERLPFDSSRHFRWLSKPFGLGVYLIASLFPRQGNQFGFYIPKPNRGALMPWLKSPTQVNEQFKTSRTLGGW